MLIYLLCYLRRDVRRDEGRPDVPVRQPAGFVRPAQKLKLALAAGFSSNLTMWATVLLAPTEVYIFFDRLLSLRTELVKLIFLIPFNYAYQQRSNRRWHLRLLAGMLASGNTVALAIVDTLLAT